MKIPFTKVDGIMGFIASLTDFDDAIRLRQWNKVANSVGNSLTAGIVAARAFGFDFGLTPEQSDQLVLGVVGLTGWIVARTTQKGNENVDSKTVGTSGTPGIV